MRCLSIAWLVLVGCGDVIVEPVSLNLCLDGLDNEDGADGLVDCEDARCSELTRCVPTSAADQPGVVVEEDAPCPEGFEGGEQIIHRGLRPGTCEGCGCTVGPTTCTGRVWLYADSNECYGDTGLSGGTLLGVPITASCTANPLYYDNPAGIRADITAEPTCMASGSAAPAPSDWQETVKFCRATPAAAGCAAAHACVPKAATPAEQCVLADDAATCGGYQRVESDWYTGVDDQRTCGACFCTAVGGDCDNVRVRIGNDYDCEVNTPLYVEDDDNLCFTQSPYSPPARLEGEPTPAAGCNAAANPTGAIDPTGQQTLCCSPT